MLLINPNEMPGRNVDVDFVIDTNRINTRKSLPSMNRLEEWHQAGVIGMVISETALAECNSPRRAEKARNYICTRNRVRVLEEHERLRKIEAALSSSAEAKSENEWRDVLIVFNAGKYGDCLVTADGASRRQPGGILGNRKKLQELGIRVMTDSEAVAFVEELIRYRDDRARSVSRNTGKALPSWVGRD